ncbi:MAG: acyl carrier protein [Stappia sp.]|uniref:acyl carrier protein n=1 Tax=Stappia sp. TaxID=1870903 RepID=UPI000C3C00AC|nr:acyl carrier protein [Stappia sp.]MAA98293.1 acyl carrier protein [Stappia sp.]MBM20888.1 acyl carrier protein [Stappia sp.]|tara:strand:- start:1826 stop:2104 length:279 start_codon:yes stop_codon:yes gene_type:complete
MTATPRDRAEIETALRDYLMENSGVPISGEIDPDENLLDSGILDSLGIAEVTEFIESNFSLTVDEEEITSENFRTLNSLSDFCHSKITAAAA